MPCACCSCERNPCITLTLSLIGSSLTWRRALLMKEALEEISKTKRARYEAWRRTTLGGLKLGRRITGALMWTIIPAIVCLQVGTCVRARESAAIGTTSWRSAAAVALCC